MFGMEVHWDNRLSPIPRCYGTLSPWQPQWNLIDSFVLSRIEFVPAKQVPWNDRHQLHSLLIW